MAGTIFSGSYLTGIVLNNAGTENPATVAAGGYVTNTGTSIGGDAIYGDSAAAWALTNLGTIKATATSATGLFLADGGNITNGGSAATGALISSSANTIIIRGAAGTVSNFGTIERTAGGTNGSAVYLGAGGLVTNGSTAATHALIESSFSGVATRNTAATVVNYGTIQGIGTTDTGIYLGGGGTITNAAGGVILGAEGVVIEK